jgi:KDO2-lipid IV(A) lauroyltransferase
MPGLIYYILKTFLTVLSWFGLKGLYLFARLLSPIAYRLIPKYRKRALSNLKLAKDLNLSNTSIEIIAKKSLFHLLLTALEYGFLYSATLIQGFCRCKNSKVTDQLLDKQQGIVFFCGHQSNWELLFLDATSRHMGVCIGKPIKNLKLYKYILAIREKFKGKVIQPKEAYKSCFKALKHGHLVGIVGDQGMPESPFKYNCLGRQAYMTTLPSLLSLRAEAPLFVATIIRHFGSYEITYTGPIAPESQDIHELTLKSLEVLDEAIKKHPEQYMWQHNRWKISYHSYIPKRYRQDAIACILGMQTQHLEEFKKLKDTYQGAYFIVFKPKELELTINAEEVYNYESLDDCFIKHYGPKLIFDLIGIEGLEKHFKKQALFEYLNTPSIIELIKTWKLGHAD